MIAPFETTTKDPGRSQVKRVHPLPIHTTTSNAVTAAPPHFTVVLVRGCGFMESEYHGFCASPGDGCGKGWRWRDVHPVGVRGIVGGVPGVRLEARRPPAMDDQAAGLKGGGVGCGQLV